MKFNMICIKLYKIKPKNLKFGPFDVFRFKKKPKLLGFSNHFSSPRKHTGRLFHFEDPQQKS